jgi:hypothetical protein
VIPDQTKLLLCEDGVYKGGQAVQNVVTVGEDCRRPKSVHQSKAQVLSIVAADTTI